MATISPYLNFPGNTERHITLPMQDMFWGDYFGMLTDQFGIQWMVAFDTKKA